MKHKPLHTAPLRMRISEARVEVLHLNDTVPLGGIWKWEWVLWDDTVTGEQYRHYYERRKGDPGH